MTRFGRRASSETDFRAHRGTFKNRATERHKSYTPGNASITSPVGIENPTFGKRATGPHTLHRIYIEASTSEHSADVRTYCGAVRLYSHPPTAD